MTPNHALERTRRQRGVVADCVDCSVLDSRCAAVVARRSTRALDVNAEGRTPKENERSGSPSAQ